MSNRILLIFSVVSALTLALTYHRILYRLSVALVSPYAKADSKRRFLAAMADVVIVAIVLFYYRAFGSPMYLLTAVAYVVLRDSIAGRSVGKFLCGLVVVNLESGRPCGASASIQRNLLFLIPGANVVAVFLETSTCVKDPQGQRLGDRFALTQVVDGFGVRDVADAIQESWLKIFHDAEHSTSRHSISGCGHRRRARSRQQRCVLRLRRSAANFPSWTGLARRGN
jgi:uncharacterized RDD family membrane protein YckC